MASGRQATGGDSDNGSPIAVPAAPPRAPRKRGNAFISGYMSRVSRAPFRTPGELTSSDLLREEDHPHRRGHG
jgi:hypothetical protein